LDPTEFKIIYLEHKKAIVGALCKKFGLDKSTAEDFFHEAMADVFVQITNGKLEPFSVSNWFSLLLTIASRKAMNNLRDEKRSQTGLAKYPVSKAENSPEQSMLDEEENVRQEAQLQNLKYKKEQLSEEDRTLLDMRAEDRSYKEIAVYFLSKEWKSQNPQSQDVPIFEEKAVKTKADALKVKYGRLIEKLRH
jgi:RNA polymerase sigma factor (sigma-70 family)